MAGDTTKDMTQGSPMKLILGFSIPLLFGFLFQQFYNVMDTIIVGRVLGVNALAGVGSTGSLNFLIIGFCMGVCNGFAIPLAHKFGAKDYSGMRRFIANGMWLSILFSAVMTIATAVFCREMLMAMKTPDDIFSYAYSYIFIIFLGIPATYLYNMLSGIIRAMGDSKTPLVFLTLSSFLNIALDLVCIIRLHMGVAGVAAATVTAQGIAAVLSFLVLMRRLKGYEGKKETFNIAILKNMVKVAIPSIIQQSIVSVGMLLVQSVVNGFGSSVLAGYTAGMRLESICIVPMISMGNAVSTFTAQNMGAGKTERVKQGYRASYFIVGVFAIIICAVLLLFKNPLIRMFLEEGAGGEAFGTGVSYLSFIAYFFVFIGLKASTDGVLRGAGDVVVFTAANLINLAIRVSFAFGMAPVIGVQAVWFAVPIGWTVNYVISGFRYLTGRWSRKKLV